MEKVQYINLSEKAKKTLFAARKIHGYDEAIADFDSWAEKFVEEFSAKGQAALIPHDPILRMYFTRSAGVCYVAHEPHNDRDQGGIPFTAAAALEAAPDNAPMLDLDGDHGLVSAVLVQVGEDRIYISLHEAEITRSVVIDMPISIDAFKKVGIEVPAGASSFYQTPGKIVFEIGTDSVECEIDREAYKSLHFSHGSYGPLRRAITR